MRHFYYLTLLLLLFISCQKTKEKSEDFIFFKNLTPTEKPIEGIPDNEVVKIVKLEFTDASMLSHISKLEITDSLIFIKDMLANHISVFSHKGKYLRQIGMRGEGPKEFINFSMFFLNEENEEVIIVDDYKRVLLYYDYLGNFLRSVSLPEEAVRYCSKGMLLDDDKLLLNYMICNVDNSAYGIVDLGKKQLSDKFFPYSPLKSRNLFYPFSFNPISKLADEIKVILPLNDTIYKYMAASGQFIPHYVIGHPKKLPSTKDITPDCANYSLERGRLWKEGFFLGFSGIYETEDKIILQFEEGVLGGIYIGDKMTNSGKYYTEVYDASTLQFPLCHIRYAYKDMFVSAISPGDCNFASFKNVKNPLVQEMLKDYSEDDNPYLFFYKLK